MKQYVALFLVCLLSFGTAIAETPQQKGLRIATEADVRDSGWSDTTADMLMTLRNRAGKTSKRTIRTKTLEGRGDGDKSLSLFDTPADVKGTAMLTFSHGLKPDDQWLYLPALKRVKRISSKNKSGPFMGSEYAFEDLGSQEIEKYSYRYLGEESCGKGWRCHKLERTPAYKYSGYTRQIGWIDTKELRPVKIEFYDRKKRKLKTLTWTSYREYLGRYWRADEMFMQNHQTGKSTRLQWKNYKFKTGLDSGDFNKNSLARLR
ncbi:MAG: outer membrane lipoprotein-sorting protein [Pseudomonadota bacterium]